MSRGLFAVGLIAATAVGCASLKIPGRSTGGFAATHAERTQQAAREFDEQRDRAEFEAAQECLDRGDTKGSEEILTRLLARNGKNRDARLLMAEVHLTAGRADQAREQVEEVLGADPDDARAQDALSLLLEVAGQPIDAPSASQRFAVTRTGGEGPVSPAGFAVAASDDADSPRAVVAAAAAALRRNQPRLAIDLLAPAEKRFPDSAALKRVLGVAYYRLGDYASSQVVLQQSLCLDKSSPLTYFLMGCTLAKLGQPESADAHFRQAQSLDPWYQLRR